MALANYQGRLIRITESASKNLTTTHAWRPPATGVQKSTRTENVRNAQLVLHQMLRIIHVIKVLTTTHAFSEHVTGTHSTLKITYVLTAQHVRSLASKEMLAIKISSTTLVLQQASATQLRVKSS